MSADYKESKFMGLLGDIFMSLLGASQSYAEKNYDKMECFNGLSSEERAEKEKEIQAKLARSRDAINNVNEYRQNRD